MNPTCLVFRSSRVFFAIDGVEVEVVEGFLLDLWHRHVAGSRFRHSHGVGIAMLRDDLVHAHATTRQQLQSIRPVDQRVPAGCKGEGQAPNPVAVCLSE